MSRLLVVSDTSALSALARMDWLEWVRLRWERVAVPEAVWAELRPIGDPSARERLETAVSGGWLARYTVTDDTAVMRLREALDAGESEAIILALELGADAVMIDELDGRNIAKEMGLPVTGTLGLLLWAKFRGLIPSAAGAMTDLEQRTKFFISDAVRTQVLKMAGETTESGN